ncbi:MAG TPA: ATP-binding cassette domain-containing protein [Nitrospinaceae bacterium]|jgi:peptide/nickel transport system ATP-binding protein/oligopeptide transport system ATP-binding protein|nr:ATP-binding cassette domain-containing protein [Nitrospinaceae bacterium]
MTTMISIRSLKKHFFIHDGFLSRNTKTVKAVDGVSLDIDHGEILGLVGESGCGKTTLGRMSINLIEPTSGEVFFDRVNILKLDKQSLNKLRPKMQIIFQDPFSSLNPRFTVERIIGEAMMVHGLADKSNLRSKITEIMQKVGLPNSFMNRYPHEFSGGQRQRIGIARALSLSPRYLVCDEPVSALDVSIQAQIINLLQELQEKENITILFISHDLNVVKHLSHRTAVMYLGQIVETAPTEILNKDAAHPYTRALLAAKPSTNPKKTNNHVSLSGDVPSPLNPPSGCHFHTRCPEAMDRCKTEKPTTLELAKEHTVKCHLYN